MPKLSVILPCYNGEAFLARAMDSALQQSFRDLEIVLVDDGSKDGTPAICDDYAARDDRVRVIHQANAGLSAARNAGMAIATGEYLAFLDADDWLVPDAYERMLRAMDEHDADCACCGYTHVYDDGGVGETVVAPFPDGVYEGDALLNGIVLPLLQDRLKEGCFTGMVWRWIFSRRVITENALCFTDAYLEDELFLIRYFSRPARLAAVDAGLYCYFLNRQSITRSYNPDMTEIYQHILTVKGELVEDFQIPVQPDWKDNCAWMELLADVGNEFGRGHKVSAAEHVRNLKKLTAVPEYRHAMDNYEPVGMNRRKTLVASLLKHRLYLPLVLLYLYKNRKF